MEVLDVALQQEGLRFASWALLCGALGFFLCGWAGATLDRAQSLFHGCIARVCFPLPLISVTSVSQYLFVLPGSDFILALFYHRLHLRLSLADSLFSQWILLFPRR